MVLLHASMEKCLDLVVLTLAPPGTSSPAPSSFKALAVHVGGKVIQVGC